MRSTAVPDERLGRVSEDIVAAVDVVGWGGVVVPRLRLCGLLVYPVVDVDHELWVQRERSGVGPQLHQFTLGLWESWQPDMGSAPPLCPVRLVGLVAVGRPRAAMRVLDQLSGYAPGLAIVAGSRTPEEMTVADADLLGVSLAWVSRDGAPTLVWRGRTTPAPTSAGRTVSLRHKEEMIYARMLATGQLRWVESRAATA